jgi:ApbE superfamily uncharacterized protein (UPF0280 family)
MRDPAIIRLLPDGRRLHLNDGPIDLIIEADGAAQAVRAAYASAARRFVTILDELCAELPLLRSRSTPQSAKPAGAIARAMAAAVFPYCEQSFITPMAAVAGAVAETVLAAMTQAADLERVYVNNGGDIAIHLSDHQQYTLGMMERPDSAALSGAIEISAASPVRGVATSGWRGRSFSLGIADAVTVLAHGAAEADAAATILANAVDLPGHPGVTRVAANQIAPDSDLGAIAVTRGVGLLTGCEVDTALCRCLPLAESLRERGLINSAALYLQGRVALVAPSGANTRFRRPSLLRSSTADPIVRHHLPRSLQHA